MRSRLTMKVEQQGACISTGRSPSSSWNAWGHTCQNRCWAFAGSFCVVLRERTQRLEELQMFMTGLLSPSNWTAQSTTFGHKRPSMIIEMHRSTPPPPFPPGRVGGTHQSCRHSHQSERAHNDGILPLSVCQIVKHLNDEDFHSGVWNGQLCL